MPINFFFLTVLFKVYICMCNILVAEGLFLFVYKKLITYFKRPTTMIAYVEVSDWSVQNIFYITVGLSEIFLLIPLLSC